MIVGTLGKALGSYGAYVCCDATMAKYLVNTARTLIFSTALPPPAVAAAMAALGLLREQPRRVEKLQRNGARAARGARRRRGCRSPAATRRSCRSIVGDAGAAVRGLRARARARRVRPGDPAADRARGHLAAAPRGDGVAHEVRAARRREGDRRRRARSTRARPPPPPRRRGRGRPSPARPRVRRPARRRVGLTVRALAARVRRASRRRSLELPAA